jgi:hypothetical protein
MAAQPNTKDDAQMETVSAPQVRIAQPRLVEESISWPTRCEDKGYIYVVNDGAGNYKIGMSLNPSYRITQIRGALRDGYFLFECPKALVRKAEQMLHGRFAEVRTHGEWFRLNAGQHDWFYNNPLPMAIPLRHAKCVCP